MSNLVRLGRGAAQALSGMLLIGLLTACGGGGGSAGVPVLGGAVGNTGGGTTGGNTATDVAVVSLALSSTTVTAGAPATVTVTVKNKAGASIPGQVVKFSSDANLAAFSAPSALTDASGVASVILSPAASTSTGADSVKATVTYAGKDYTATTGFQLTATNVTITSFTSDVAQLSAYGQANLTVVLAGTSSNSPVNLVLTSSCTNSGKGALTPAAQTTSTGRATFTFRDGGCGAIATSENLQVSVTGTSLTQALRVPVSSPDVASIGFVSSTPSAIYLRGSGYIENADVIFQVKDRSNNGLPGQIVVLEPSVLVGGLTLDGGSTAVSKLSDKDGNVIVRINSGTVPTPVRIKATLQGSNISTVSSSLAIAVGLPSQLNFSLAQGTRNIEGFSIQGTPNTYSIIASDRLGNPVPNDTAINFVTEGGQIQAIKQTQLDGRGIATTTANFASASPVPTDGRITVVAYALGEKSFLDVNGNNVYDVGEDFQDLGDIFLDRKFDNFYQQSDDQFVSVTTGDKSPCLTAASPLLAADVSIPSRPNTCNQSWGRAYVRRAIQTVLSTSDARPLWGKAWHPNAVGKGGECLKANELTDDYTDNVANKTLYRRFGAAPLYGISVGGVLVLIVADANSEAFNPMAAGTVISAVATDGLTASVVAGTPVPNTAAPTSAAISYKFDDKTTEGTIFVTFRSPSGLGTTVSQFISAKTYGATVVGTVPVVPATTPPTFTLSPDEEYRKSLLPCSN